MPSPFGELQVKLARLMGETIVGIPDAFAGNSFGSARLSVYEDDYFNDWSGRFFKGPHAGTSFSVTDFEDTGGIVSFGPPLPEDVDADDRFYMLIDPFTPEELIDALNVAIDMVDDEALQDRVDESLVVSNSVWEYPVPAGLLYIEAVVLESGTSGRYSPSRDTIDERHWDILTRQPEPLLWFDDQYTALVDNRHLRLIGQAAASQMSSDLEVCPVGDAFLLYQAKAMLHESRISGADPEGHRTRALVAQARADRERDGLLVPSRGKRVVY